MSSHPDPAWHGLGSPEPGSLGEAWRQLHWAAQAPAAFAAATLAAEADDSHVNLGWDAGLGALTSHLVAGHLRAGLRLADQTLLLVDGDRIAEEHALDGRTLREALTWLRAAAERVMEAPPKAELTLRSWDMPEHAVGSGGRFEPGPAADFAEIARWYADADLVLGALAAGTEGASAVRCWPHHFDLATLVTLDPGASAESARTIGIGLAPADASFDQPYFYANPWPHPEAPRPGELEGGGEWHSEGWFGAVLRGSTLAAAPAAEQRARVEAFLSSAVAADLALLGSAR